MHKVTSASGTNLGSIGRCHLTFRLGDKSCTDTDKFIFLKDLWRNFIVVLNWQSNDKNGCNWNINGHQYVTHNKYLCTSPSSVELKPIIHNPGAFYLKPRSMSVIMVQAPTEFDKQHIYTINSSDDLPLGLIPLAINHEIDHKYPKSMFTHTQHRI